MAYIGLRKPIAGAFDGTKYSTPAALGKAVSIEITPEYAEGSLYADDMKAEEDKEFVDATVTLGVSTVPSAFNTTLFGHTVSTEGETTYNADDAAGYVGLGIIGVEKIDGSKKFVATFLPKVKFSEPGKSYETKSDSITYNTPSLEGTAFALDSGVWKYDQPFDTEAEAVAYLNKKFGTATTSSSSGS